LNPLKYKRFKISVNFKLGFNIDQNVLLISLRQLQNFAEYYFWSIGYLYGFDVCRMSILTSLENWAYLKFKWYRKVRFKRTFLNG